MRTAQHSLLQINTSVACHGYGELLSVRIACHPIADVAALLCAFQSIFRADNRLGREIRPIAFSLDTSPAADGSATCEMGLTVVQVAVYGPRESRGGAGQGGGGGAAGKGEEARVEVDVSVAGFVAGERKKRGRGDR